MSDPKTLPERLHEDAQTWPSGAPVRLLLREAADRITQLEAALGACRAVARTTRDCMDMTDTARGWVLSAIAQADALLHPAPSQSTKETA